MNGITPKAIAEMTGYAVAQYLEALVSGKKLVIYTSPNRRAAHAATIFAEVAGVPLFVRDSLRCINLRTDISDEKLLEIMDKVGKDSGGAPPLEEEIIDTVTTSGQGTYQRMAMNMRKLALPVVRDGIIEIDVTHTQQTQLRDELSGFGKTDRYDEGGFLVHSDNEYLRMKSGIWTPAT